MAEDYSEKEISEALKEAQSSTEETRSEKGIKALLNLIQARDVLLFHDQFNEGHAALCGDGSDIKKLRSREFRQWLIKNYYVETGKATNDATIKMAIALMECSASDGPRIELNVRVARKGMILWYDLGDGRAVKTDSTGWSIEDKTPILFRRFKHQIPQVTPEKGGSLDDFVQLANVKTDNDRILLKVYLVAAFIAGFPHPVMMPHGDQGAAKSTLCKMIKKLVDPSCVDLFEPPSKNGLNEFIQTASHHWIIFLDNMSYLSDELSDMLARICTGQGHSKRILYSDDDDFVYNFQHIVGLNGINQVIRKPDLLNRSMLLQMEKISDDNRLEEEELWKLFNEMKPKTLGAIFDAVSSALRYYEQIKLPKKPRMADFTRWGCAIAKGLGYTEDNFIKAYGANIAEQNEQALEASGMAQVIIKYVNDHMQDVTEQAHTPTELFNLLQPIADELKIGKDFPQSATWLWRKIKPLASDLMEKGIHIEKGKEGDRNIAIKKAVHSVQVETPPLTHTQQDQTKTVPQEQKVTAKEEQDSFEDLMQQAVDDF